MSITYTIGQNCEVVIDGTGYFIEPGSYHMKRPRTRKATMRADNNEAYVDLGPGKREWSMTLLCLNELTNLDGTAAPLDGESYRDAIYGSYVNSVGSSVIFIDPVGSSANVHIDSYVEQIVDVRGSQQIALATGQNTPRMTYKVAIVLLEA
jgi:hypothetical protein